MEEYVLITRKEIKRNKSLKLLQKTSIKKYRRTKGRFPKAKLGKVVKLRDQDTFLDLAKGDYRELHTITPDRDSILSEIRRQGVPGFGGSGFPAAVKLQTVLEAKADRKYLIINAVECDPGLLHDRWLLMNRFSEVEKGITLLTACAHFHKVILATKEDIKTNSQAYEIHTVPDRYPMGAERILIQEVTGIPLTNQDIPAEKGILVLNIQTVHAIYEAVLQNRPADSRFITVADLTSGEASVVRVKLNTSVAEIAAKVSGVKRKPVYYGGGIMSGKKAGEEDLVTEKTNFIGYGKEAVSFTDKSCMKCGACAKKCPMEIPVHKIIQSLEKKELDAAKELHPQRCIKCGTCTYYCHAGKNTMELINSCFSQES